MDIEKFNKANKIHSELKELKELKKNICKYSTRKSDKRRAKR